MAEFELIGLIEATPQLLAPTSSDTALIIPPLTADRYYAQNDGTEALPSYSFDIGGNKAYGMWYGNGELHFSINGVEVALFGAGIIAGTPDATSSASKLQGWRYQVLNRTTSVQENAESHRGIITNAGAGAPTTHTLDEAVAGEDLTFIDNNATHRMTVVPNTADQIIWTDGTVVSASTGSLVSTARYDSFRCQSLDVTTYVVVHATGTWTVTG